MDSGDCPQGSRRGLSTVTQRDELAEGHISLCPRVVPSASGSTVRDGTPTSCQRRTRSERQGIRRGDLTGAFRVAIIATPAGCGVDNHRAYCWEEAVAGLSPLDAPSDVAAPGFWGCEQLTFCP